jgi:diaminopimelate decarboxylase
VPVAAIVARAGVTVYRVVAVTGSGSDHRLIAVDGGITDRSGAPLDNCRHSVALIGRFPEAAPRRTTIVGRHNQAGDIVASEIDLPADVHPGDLLAVAGSGAYHHPMASNYHLVPRPALIAVRDGRARTLVRRELVDDLLARDVDG